jgi:hypothetical protein
MAEYKERKKINKQKLDEIVELIIDNLEYDIETMGHQDYDVTAFLQRKYVQKIIDELNNILEEE